MQSEKLSELSVFFPAYNEEKNIKKVLLETIDVIGRYADKFEIVVVNDGSKDSTRDIVEQMSKEYPVIRCINHDTNKGYGGAVKTAMKNVKYKFVFYSDSDGQFAINQIEKLIGLIKNADIAVGYRMKRQDPFYRTMNAKAYNILVRILFGLKVRDIDCAFKLFKKSVIENVEIKSDSQFLIAEFLIKALKKGFVIREVGVEHLPRVYGKPTGNSLRAIVGSFRDLFWLYNELKPEIRQSEKANPSFLEDKFKVKKSK